MWWSKKKEIRPSDVVVVAEREISGNDRSIVRRLPWIEGIGTALGALLFYFVLKKPEMAEFFAITGILVTLGRLGYTAELEKEVRHLREPLDRIHEFFDLSAQAHFTAFREPLQVYAKITEEEFSRVKDGIVAEANSQLLFLANEKKSQVLVTTKYYGWLLPMLEKAVPPQTQRIWALSLMREPEWDDSPPERRFIELSRTAAERGVQIDRIFVMKKEVVARALGISAVTLHLQTEEPRKLRGFVVEMETLARADEDLEQQLGDGFIVFDDRVALVDVFSGRSARGYVTMNRGEIEHLREVYNRLLILAESLDAVAARHAAETALKGVNAVDRSEAKAPTPVIPRKSGEGQTVA